MRSVDVQSAILLDLTKQNSLIRVEAAYGKHRVPGCPL